VAVGTVVEADPLDDAAVVVAVVAAVVDEVVEAAPSDGVAVVGVVVGFFEGGLAVEDPQAANTAALERATQATTARRDRRPRELTCTGTL
jgi:hypothetical protein